MRTNVVRRERPASVIPTTNFYSSENVIGRKSSLENITDEVTNVERHKRHQKIEESEVREPPKPYAPAAELAELENEFEEDLTSKIYEKEAVKSPPVSPVKSNYGSNKSNDEIGKQKDIYRLHVLFLPNFNISHCQFVKH